MSPKLAPLWAPSSTQPGFSQPGPHPRGTGAWLTSPLPRGSAPRLPSPLPQPGPQERPAETLPFRPVQRVPPTPPLSDSRGPSLAALLPPAPAELRFGAAAGLSPVLSWVPPSAAPWYCPGAGPNPQSTQPPLLPPPFPETPQIPPALLPRIRARSGLPVSKSARASPRLPTSTHTRAILLPPIFKALSILCPHPESPHVLSFLSSLPLLDSSGDPASHPLRGSQPSLARPRPH